MQVIKSLMAALAREGVEFVVVGGVALNLRGHARSTLDLDVCYARTPENFARLERALLPLHPRLRDIAPGLPFTLDARALKSGLNFTLSTDAGDLDLFGELPGVGTYAQARALSGPLTLDGMTVHVLDLEGLERAKRAAGRAKDLMDLAAIQKLRGR